MVQTKSSEGGRLCNTVDTVFLAHIYIAVLMHRNSEAARGLTLESLSAQCENEVWVSHWKVSFVGGFELVL